MSKEGGKQLTAEDLGLVLLGDVNHVYGNTVTLLEKPTGVVGILFLAESGDWRIKKGDFSTGGGALTATPPSADVEDGTGSWKLQETDKQAFQALNAFTVIGSAADSILTYFWI